jgi:hypothetical protein
MKKLLIGLLITITSTLAFSSGPVMFTQPSGRGTSNDIWVELTRSALADAGVSHRYEVGTCQTSIAAWRDAGTKQPSLMLYSSNWARGSLQNGIPCIMDDFDKITVYAVIRQPWWICHNAKTSKPLNSARVKVGYPAKIVPIDAKDLFDDINKLNGFDWRLVPNNGSGDSFMMLLNGDVDYAFVSKSFAKNKITNTDVQCNLSWKPDDEIPFFLDKIRMTNDPTNILYFTSIVIGKNMTPELDQLAKNTYSNRNPKFNSWMDSMSAKSIHPSDSRTWMNNFINTIRDDLKKFK